MLTALNLLLSSRGGQRPSDSSPICLKVGISPHFRAENTEVQRGLQGHSLRGVTADSSSGGDEVSGTGVARGRWIFNNNKNSDDNDKKHKNIKILVTTAAAKRSVYSSLSCKSTPPGGCPHQRLPLTKLGCPPSPRPASPVQGPGWLSVPRCRPSQLPSSSLLPLCPSSFPAYF